MMTGGNGLFQQDNAPIHTADQTRQFLQENGINCLDMNPIENVWARMEVNLQREYETPTDSDQLFETLEQVWSELMEDGSYRRSLIHSLVYRVNALVTSEGGFTQF